MARIDCSVTVNFLRVWRRMCLIEHARCNDKCPFGICENGEGLGCDAFVQKFPMTAVEVAQRWSDEYSTKTRLDDLLEKCPNVPLNCVGTPRFDPWMLGYCDKCSDCPNCIGDEYCWHEPVNGGATGKAVE